ncbi:hypothetical protein [Actinomadura rudentiformis]|uniref:Ig-like domain repeat protein n=1 Tax=Actinomadura rudentiformis TaxID=359158 RepID=A0A6H9Y5Z4_9ACTN|nr:hypothetical protein [Actinomadura rudentiformis]KAB2339501.1 hypothetical protein F8566_48010 [Actinomadura rudentiformis]
MHRTSLLVAAAGMALAWMAGPAHADGPTLPGNARPTVVTVSPSKVKPGDTVRVKVRCMTHVGGKAVLKVSSPAFPEATAVREHKTFTPRLDPSIKAGSYTVRAACKAPGAFVKKAPYADDARFTVVAPPAPPAPEKEPVTSRTKQTRKVPAGAAATGFGEVLGRR